MQDRKFSLSIYLFVVLLLSWPFQMAFLFLGNPYRPLLLVSMIMVGLATFLCGKLIFKDGFVGAGFSWGRPKHYILAFILPLCLWLVPLLIEKTFSLSPVTRVDGMSLLISFGSSFLVTLIPAFGEEFSWRGYLLPRLLKAYSPKKALLIHGGITWFWHLPVIVAMGIMTPGNPAITIPAVALVSLIPTVMHAIVFAFFWSTSKSLAVATTYHSAFDETRDTLQGVIGFGPLVEVWQMGMLTMLGVILLIKNQWLKPQS